MSEVFVEHISGEYDSETTMQICCMCGVMLKRPGSGRLTLRPGLKVLMDRMEIGMIFDHSAVIEGDIIVSCHDRRTTRIVEETQNQTKMRTIKKVQLELVHTEYIPETMEFGKMYYSEKYNVTNHLCPCGCGTQTPLPIKPGEWGILISGEKFTISPSVLHRSGCKSHYVINNSIASIID